MPYFSDQQGFQALDPNQQVLRLAGYGIVSGGAVSQASNPYDLSVTSTTADFGASSVDVPAQNVTLQSFVSETPRKALICVAEDGSLVIEAGAAEEARPQGELRAATYRPAPPALAGRTDVLPLAEIWLGANATEIVAEDIIHDRRVPPRADLREVAAETGDFEAIEDGAGVAHTGELADLADVRTNADIETVINDDPDHATTADHDYYTDTETINTVEAHNEAFSIDILGDADTLDGQHASAFAATVHNHDPRYLEDASGVVTADHLATDYVSEGEFTARQDAVVTSGAATLTGGQNPAATITASVGVSLGADLEVDYAVDTSGGFAGGFAFGITESGWEQRWDPSANGGSGGYTVELVLSWASPSSDPGSGNDVPVAYDVINESETDF